MKKVVLFFLSLFLLLPAQAVGQTVVTSFYPIWLFTLNLTEGVPDVEVRNLAAPDTGCLHDYQLQTADMKVLSGASALLVNGAGMEAFLPLLEQALPELPVIVAADNIPLLQDTDAREIGEAEEEEEVNAHLWLDAGRAVRMCENLAAGLKQVLPEHADAIQHNLEAYSERLLALDETIRAGLSDLPRREIVTFHEAFPYFAEAYGIRVAAVVSREPGDPLTPVQLAQITETVRELGNIPLFVEPQYDDLSARTISAETGAPIYTLDPVVTGPESDVPLDYYESVMLRNMETLQEALSD